MNQLPQEQIASPRRRDYSLIGRDAHMAVANGLAAAEWYHSDIPRSRIKELMRRTDGPAIRDTLLWLALFVVFAGGAYAFWGSWSCVPFFFAYGVLYGSSSDSRWHESGHGTAFRTRWMNDFLYQLSSFMIMREPTIWRWSHARHHTDTIIVGRDPEIAVMRPPDLFLLLLNVLAIRSTLRALRLVVIHAFGRLTAEEKTFVPEMEHAKVFAVARVWLLIHASVVALALYLGSWLPVMLIGPLPTMYGGWLALYFGLTQHAGLAEDVLDHRLNSRTVYMNPVFRFLYWNMNYHVEHHMFPMVPYHALPRLHLLLLPDMPKPYASTIEAYREIISALWRQLKEPAFHVERRLPASARPYRPEFHGQASPLGSGGSLS
jgi:fatty acid desaturase